MARSSLPCFFLAASITMVAGCPLHTPEDTGPLGNETGLTGSWSVAEMTTIKEYGKSVDWLPEGNLIVSARPMYDGYYDLFVFSMDDPEQETWLTHRAEGAPTKHNGNPSWHPGGHSIVFTAENEDVPPELDDVALPGRGANCNLWLARADGSGFYQLTHHETAVMDARGTLHPQFSPDGSELMWADRAGEAEGSFWGHWVVKVADFVDDGIDDPHLENIRTFDPAAQHGFYETHAFSHDGQRVLFTGNLEEGQHETGMDLYEMDVASGERRQLTTTFDDWDEHAHWAPTHDHVVWMSSTDLDVSYPDDMGPLDWRHYLATEMWIMDPDGSNRQRLTFFNDPEHEHHIAARTVVSDSTWAPDGMSLLTLIAFYDDTGPQSEVYIELMHIELQQD